MAASSPFFGGARTTADRRVDDVDALGLQLVGKFAAVVSLIVEWIAMTVPGLACAASSPTTSRTCASLSTVTLMMSAAATSATLSASLAPCLGQRRHRLGPDVEHRQAAGPVDQPLGHRRAHVAQADVAELDGRHS